MKPRLEAWEGVSPFFRAVHVLHVQLHHFVKQQLQEVRLQVSSRGVSGCLFIVPCAKITKPGMVGVACCQTWSAVRGNPSMTSPAPSATSGLKITSKSASPTCQATQTPSITILYLPPALAIAYELVPKCECSCTAPSALFAAQAEMTGHCKDPLIACIHMREKGQDIHHGVGHQLSLVHEVFDALVALEQR